MEPKYNVDERVKVVLINEYTQKEIEHYGCHPKVNGMDATIESVNLVGDEFSYELLMDEELELLPDHSANFAYPSRAYTERESNLIAIK